MFTDSGDTIGSHDRPTGVAACSDSLRGACNIGVVRSNTNGCIAKNND